MTNENEFKVEWVDIDSVNLWESNPRKNATAVKKLASLIKEVGIRSPISVWRQNNIIYKGNTTWKACKLLGMEKIPVIFHDFTDEAEAVAYGIADNKASEYAEWDTDLLVESIKSLPKFLKTETHLGFEEKHIDFFDTFPPKQISRNPHGRPAESKNKDKLVKIYVDSKYFEEFLPILNNLNDKYPFIRVEC